MARHFVELVFDDFVFGAGVDAYTASKWEGVLGSVSRVALQVVVDEVSGGGSVLLSVQAEHSADGRTWADIRTAPEVERASLSTTGTTVVDGFIAYPEPNLRLLRLRIWLDGTGPGAHVRVYATGRGRA